LKIIGSLVMRYFSPGDSICEELWIETVSCFLRSIPALLVFYVC
jgi:hypothetical protein